VLVDADSVPLVLAESTTPVPSGDAIGAVTRLKDAEEIAVIRRNLAGNDRAFARVGRELGAGVTDLEVAAWAVGEVSVHAGAVVRYDGNVGLGPAGADPEAQPAGRVAAIGDLLFVDLYPMRSGYGGDSARSFHLGSPDTWVAASHERLVRALEAAERRIAPGVPAAEIDGLCRDVAADEDGATYPHHSGHGFGLFAQERPYLVPGSTDVLQEGDVVAIEPGAYRPGRGGMRLEDAFVVTAGGCERLNTAPRELMVCG
jgi:D-alanyl-D-alanine dipeptidase